MDIGQRYNNPYLKQTNKKTPNQITIIKSQTQFSFPVTQLQNKSYFQQTSALFHHLLGETQHSPKYSEEGTWGSSTLLFI